MALGDIDLVSKHPERRWQSCRLHHDYKEEKAVELTLNGVAAMSALVLCIPALVGGGAEHVMIRMANWWAARGVSVHLITFVEDMPSCPLHPAVRRVTLEAMRPACLPQEPLWSEEANNIAQLRMALEDCLAVTSIRPLPVIGFLSRMNMRLLLAAQGLPCRTIVSERTYPPACPLSPNEERLRRALYPRADHVVFQTEKSKNWGCTFLEPEHCVVIPNPVHLPSEAPPFPHAPQLTDRKFFLAAGRFAEEKRFDRLIAAFAPLAARHEEIDLLIAGEGPLRPTLEAQARAAGLGERVFLPGFIGNLPWFMRRAVAFVLSSDFEGFPNVLLESLACGCPVIAFDCPTGPGEIVRHNVDGLLVKAGDVQALQATMSTILTDSDLRARLAAHAPEVVRRFSEQDIMARWNSTVLYKN